MATVIKPIRSLTYTHNNITCLLRGKTTFGRFSSIAPACRTPTTTAPSLNRSHQARRPLHPHGLTIKAYSAVSGTEKAVQRRRQRPQAARVFRVPPKGINIIDNPSRSSHLLTNSTEDTMYWDRRTPMSELFRSRSRVHLRRGQETRSCKRIF